MAARTRKKKQTLAEFRAWLSGVEELQPDGWAPDAKQWILIRDKIDGIIMPKEVVALTPAPAPTPVPQQHGNPYQTGANVYIPPPPQAVGVPPGPVVEAQQPAAQPPVTLKPAPEIDIAGAAKPNLDTSDGNYNSGFS